MTARTAPSEAQDEALNRHLHFGSLASVERKARSLKLFGTSPKRGALLPISGRVLRVLDHEQTFAVFEATLKLLEDHERLLRAEAKRSRPRSN